MINIIGSVPVLNSEGEVLSFRRVSETEGPTVPNTFDGPTFGMQIRNGSTDRFFKKNDPRHPGKRSKERE